ncbi:unnamed protein product [Trifolium pratense]|uniref:Uncharacterized protein n=1 Tax=Trifolium pratense TaxID=57577 RepID=A0ACB0LEK0_TRIPR|nr:unnamed protein product [Trifolium pratense]
MSFTTTANGVPSNSKVSMMLGRRRIPIHTSFHVCGDADPDVCNGSACGTWDFKRRRWDPFKDGVVRCPYWILVLGYVGCYRVSRRNFRPCYWFYGFRYHGCYEEIWWVGFFQTSECVCLMHLCLCDYTKWKFLKRCFWVVRKPEEARNLVELAESFWLKPEKATDSVELAESFWLKPDKATYLVVLVTHFWLQPEKARRAGR